MKTLKHKVLLTICLLVFLLSGCRFTPMNGFEIYSYVHKVTGRYLFTLKKVNDDTNSYQYWNVHDLKNNMVFHVYDHLDFNLFYAERMLANDFTYTLINENMDELPLGDGIEYVCENGNTTGKYANYFELTYVDMEDLNKKYDRLTEIAAVLDKKSKGFEVPYHFEYVGGESRDYSVSRPAFEIEIAADRDKATYKELKSKAPYEDVKYSFLSYCYTYQLQKFKDDIANLTEEEFDRLFYYNGHIYDVIITKDDGTSYTLPYVVGGHKDMTIGNLFLLCEKEGLNVTGNPEEFTVVSPSGETYRFSYGFVGDYHPYYYRGDEKIEIDGEECSIPLWQISEMCGFSVTTSRHQNN